MIGQVYDHIIGLVIAGAIFVAAVFIVPNISYVNLLYVDQQQLRNKALEVFKAILLGAGSPTNWGSLDPFDQNDVQSFGLAYAGSSSFYVLDPDKVQRLIVNNRIGYIEYTRVRQLLGLQGYGFRLRIIPPFNVSIVNWRIESNVLSFDVRVSFGDGRPISNALVDATIVYSTQNAINVSYPSRTYTNFFGMSTINATLDPGWLDVIAIVKVTFGDLTTMVARYNAPPPNNIADINMIGDRIFLTFTGFEPSGKRYVDNIIVGSSSQDKLMFLYNGTRAKQDKLDYGSGSSFRTVWSRTFNGLQQNNPIALIFNFWDDQANRQVLMVADPHPLNSGSQSASSLTWTNSPSADSGDPEWINPTYAYANDTSFASCSKKDKKRIYSGYGFSIDSDAVVSSVRVRLDVKAATDDKIKLRVSSNGGSDWLGFTYTSPPLTSTEQTIWVDVTSWTSWTPSNINNNQIQTRVEQKKNGEQDTTFLDWIPIEVTFFIPNLMSSRNIQFGGSFAGGSTPMVKLERAVVIFGITHIVELTFWKESP